MFKITSIKATVNIIQEWYDTTEFIKDLSEYIRIMEWEEACYKYFIEVNKLLFSNLSISKTFISYNTKVLLMSLVTPVFK